MIQKEAFLLAPLDLNQDLQKVQPIMGCTFISNDSKLTKYHKSMVLGLMTKNAKLTKRNLDKIQEELRLWNRQLTDLGKIGSKEIEDIQQYYADLINSMETCAREIQQQQIAELCMFGGVSSCAVYIYWKLFRFPTLYKTSLQWYKSFFPLIHFERNTNFTIQDYAITSLFNFAAMSTMNALMISGSAIKSQGLKLHYQLKRHHDVCNTFNSLIDCITKSKALPHLDTSKLCKIDTSIDTGLFSYFTPKILMPKKVISEISDDESTKQLDQSVAPRCAP